MALQDCSSEMLDPVQAALLHPGVTIGDSSLPSGCFGKTGVTSGQLFGWEMIMTFVLVMTVYAVASKFSRQLFLCPLISKKMF